MQATEGTDVNMGGRIVDVINRDKGRWLSACFVWAVEGDDLTAIP